MDLNKIVDNNAERLSKKKNVVAVAVGKKWSNGQPTDEDAIIVLVDKKEDISSLKDEDKIESEIEGIKTDVVGRSGKFRKLGFRNRQRPAFGGVSCGHPKITAGTLGGVFLDKHGHRVILSNNHVLSNEDKAKIGDYIYQPGPYDGGSYKDRIATLHQFKPIKKGVANKEDSAIAIINGKISDKIKKIGKPVGFNLKPRINQKVMKSGRTTGYTKGKIIGTNATIFVSYDMGTIKFKNQIITSYMSEGGDSGSLLIDGNKRVVGLLFAGSDTMTVHNPIKFPKKTYGLRIISDKKTKSKKIKSKKKKARKRKKPKNRRRIRSIRRK